MTPAGALQVVYRQPSELKAYEKNARTHSPKQVEQICASIAEFGFTSPILIDEESVVIAGHGRLEAAKKLGLTTVPTICLHGLSESQRRALVLADNKIAANSGWDSELLIAELQDLRGAGFDLGLTGFADRELGELLQPTSKRGSTHPDDAPEVSETAVSCIGDVWICGDHRVGCGSALEKEFFSSVMGGGRTGRRGVVGPSV